MPEVEEVRQMENETTGRERREHRRRGILRDLQSGQFVKEMGIAELRATGDVLFGSPDGRKPQSKDVALLLRTRFAADAAKRKPPVSG